MLKFKALTAGLLVAAALTPFMAKAQTDYDDTHEVAFDVEEACQLVIVQGNNVAPWEDDTFLDDDGGVTGGLGAEDVFFGTLSILSTPADREVLSTETEGAAVRMRCSEPYSLTVQAAAANFTDENSVATSKPVSELYFKGAEFTQVAYTAMSNTPITVLTNAPQTDLEYHPVDYYVDIKADDTAGTYSTILTYTATV